MTDSDIFGAEIIFRKMKDREDRNKLRAERAQARREVLSAQHEKHHVSAKSCKK